MRSTSVVSAIKKNYLLYFGVQHIQQIIIYFIINHFFFPVDISYYLSQTEIFIG